MKYSNLGALKSPYLESQLSVFCFGRQHQILNKKKFQLWLILIAKRFRSTKSCTKDAAIANNQAVSLIDDSQSCLPFIRCQNCGDAWISIHDSSLKLFHTYSRLLHTHTSAQAHDTCTQQAHVQTHHIHSAQQHTLSVQTHYTRAPTCITRNTYYTHPGPSNHSKSNTQSQWIEGRQDTHTSAHSTRTSTQQYTAHMASRTVHSTHNTHSTQ